MAARKSMADLDDKRGPDKLRGRRKVAAAASEPRKAAGAFVAMLRSPKPPCLRGRVSSKGTSFGRDFLSSRRVAMAASNTS